MKVIQQFLVSSVGGPGFAAIQQGGEDYCSINIKFGGHADSSLLPDCFSETPESAFGF